MRRRVDDGSRGPDSQRRQQLDEARVHDPARVGERVEGQAGRGAHLGPGGEARGEVREVPVKRALGGGERHRGRGVEGDEAGLPAAGAPPGGVLVEVALLGAEPAVLLVS